ncbi:hypothetical protein HMPREF0972_00155 [Actinomyces sp. oral taxon 848 str. F0332]|nr:hypothetical protein HMPREF0972_00155 [Actinomyces sp. oral taxon 848 str. F0332]
MGCPPGKADPAVICALYGRSDRRGAGEGRQAPPSNRFRPAGLRRRTASDLRAFAVEPAACPIPSQHRNRPDTGTVPTRGLRLPVA